MTTPLRTLQSLGLCIEPRRYRRHIVEIGERREPDATSTLLHSSLVRWWALEAAASDVGAHVIHPREVISMVRPPI